MRSIKGNRPAKLTPEDVRKIDDWMQRKPGYSQRHKVMVQHICKRLGVSKPTVYDAFNRVGAYAGVPRG